MKYEDNKNAVNEAAEADEVDGFNEHIGTSESATQDQHP